MIWRLGRMAARSGGRNPRPANYTWSMPTRLIWITLILGTALVAKPVPTLITIGVLAALTLVLAACTRTRRSRTWARDQLPEMRARRLAQQARRDPLDVVMNQYARQDAAKKKGDRHGAS